MSDFPDARLHVVSGKGGTGKTTVAAALALALAAGGKQVLLCEVEGRQGVAQLFDVPPLPYEERKVAVAPGGGDVWALAIDPEAALLDYLHLFYKLSPNGLPARTLRRMGAIDFATTIAPGLRDVLLTGKVKEATVRQRAGGRPFYDAVVLDAPPTGRVARFLNISHEVGGLAKVGPLKSQSDSVMAVLTSPLTAVHLVTLLEEMPVQECITRDNVSVRVDAVVYFRVIDAVKAVVNVQNYLFAVSQVAQTSLRSVAGKADLDELLSERDRINLDLRSVIDEPTEGPWGVKIERVELKDIALPEGMQRSMSRQAEAERERRARVIAADGELQASQKLAEAGRALAAEPSGLQLRLLQTVVDVAAEKNSTLVMPVPVELLRFFEAVRDRG
jgi:regulator of protease activity HflC (stomatin/prohibitin superfamily)